MADNTNTILCGIRFATALALLPADLIPAGIVIVERKLPNHPKARAFIKHLRRQWVNKPEVSYTFLI